MSLTSSPAPIKGRHNKCRKCGQPSGAFKFCRAHRKENAAKARASRAAQGGRRTRRGVSFPIASSDFYRDQDVRGHDAASMPADIADAHEAAVLLRPEMWAIGLGV
jgi:hypothetical protein